MPLKPTAKERNDWLEKIRFASATLHSACFNINVGESVKGCEDPELRNREIAMGQIADMRKSLDALEALVRTP